MDQQESAYLACMGLQIQSPDLHIPRACGHTYNLSTWEVEEEGLEI